MFKLGDHVRIACSDDSRTGRITKVLSSDSYVVSWLDGKDTAEDGDDLSMECGCWSGQKLGRHTPNPPSA